MTETAIIDEAAGIPNPGTIQLVEPIPRAGGDITALTLRKPCAGDLRNLNMTDLMNGGVSAVITLLPRITTPTIAAHEAERLSAEDTAEIAGTIVGFFMSPAQKDMVRKLTGG
jgi:hypothetical protein